MIPWVGSEKHLGQQLESMNTRPWREASLKTRVTPPPPARPPCRVENEDSPLRMSLASGNVDERPRRSCRCTSVRVLAVVLTLRVRESVEAARSGTQVLCQIGRVWRALLMVVVRGRARLCRQEYRRSSVSDNDPDLFTFDAQTYRVFLIDEVARLGQPAAAQAAWLTAQGVGVDELMMSLDDRMLGLSMAVPDEITPDAETSVRELHAYLLALPSESYRASPGGTIAELLESADEWQHARELAAHALSALAPRPWERFEADATSAIQDEVRAASRPLADGRCLGSMDLQRTRDDPHESSARVRVISGRKVVDWLTFPVWRDGAPVKSLQDLRESARAEVKRLSG